MVELEDLGGRRMGGYTTELELKPWVYSEQKKFKVYLKGSGKRFIVIDGIYSSGVKSEGIKGWVDCEYLENPKQEGGLAEELFKLLGSLVPPGGSLMVAYVMFSNESRVHGETSEGLKLGIPPVATPIGYLMFKAGCGVNFKDWYIPEGGREGPQKLQGFKALDERHRKTRGREMSADLKRFLKKRVEHPGIEEPARKRARFVLQSL